VVLGPIWRATSGAEAVPLGEEALGRRAREIASALLAEIESAAEHSARFMQEELGFALVRTALDRSLAKLARLDCWGRANQLPSSQFWSLAGPTLELGWLHSRARHKPLGYAGDFEMFVRFWEATCDAHPLGRLFDRYFQQQAAVEAVRSRTAQLAAAIAAHALAHDRGTYRLASVGSGPAIDVELALRLLPDDRRSDMRVTLIDLDQQALDHAVRRLDGLISGERLTAHRANLFRLAEQPRTADLLADSDFIICSGLFDYLLDAPATRLLAACWSRLAPGGCLMVGNFAPHHPSRAYMEWFGNWYLVYRSPDELNALARSAGIDARHVCIGAERLGIDLFLRAVQPD
jgi:extracellular factor (EF) 3-hydroxypalmitic acid methyl ester biosynthesis protein